MFHRAYVLGLIGVLILTTSVNGAIVTPPVSNFHYLFVTSGKLNAPNYMVEYQAHVDGQVAMNPALATMSNTWYPLMSTSWDGHDANDNLPTDDYPVYNTAGVKIADSISDLWSSSLLASPGFNQFGDSVGNARVWTGSDANGNRHSVPPSAYVDYGIASATDGSWFSSGTALRKYNAYAVYALSSAISSPVPEPASLILWSVLGALGFMISRRHG